MRAPGHPRYPNPDPRVQARIEHNRRVGEVTVWRGGSWETTAILLKVQDAGRTVTGSRMVDLTTEQGAFLATGVAAGHYTERLLGCRLRFCWKGGEVRRFVSGRPPLVVEPRPVQPRPPGVSWAVFHEVHRRQRDRPAS